MLSPGLDQLQHLVVLMMETRSLDIIPKGRKAVDPRPSVLTMLAGEFGVFTQWFASVPGPARCSRVVAHYGDTNRELKSIYERIIDADLTAKLYCGDETSATLKIVDVPEDQPQLVGTYAQFLANCRAGTLPAYAFVEPNDSGRDGDADTIAAVYNAIRNNAALWRTTALLVTCEHAGQPPQLDRQGVRVPAVLISPWIPKGTIVDDRVFEHASIPATATEWLLPAFNDGERSPRETAAETFLDLLSLQEIRTNTPRLQLRSIS